MNRVLLSVSSVVLVIGVWFASAQAQGRVVQVEVHDRTLAYVGSEGKLSTLQLPCSGLSVLQHHNLVMVGCGDAGVVVLQENGEGALVILNHQDVGKPVDKLFLGDGSVWVRSGESAFPLDDALWKDALSKEAAPVVADGPEASPPSTPVEPAVAAPVTDAAIWIGPSANTGGSSRPAPRQDLVGEVIENRGGTVVVNFGSQQGVVIGTHVELFELTDVNLGGENAALRERQLAVGVVTAVSESRAEVELSVNEQAPEGSRAQVTNKRTTRSIWASPRVGDIWEFSAMLRPFIGLESFVVGTVSQLDLNYRFEAPVRLRLIVDPLGVGFTDDGLILGMAANIIASYDAEVFEVGLGVGWTVVNENPEDFFDSGEGSADDLNSGFALAQFARFGAEEGFNLIFYNSFVLYKGVFYYGGTTGTMQFPLGTHGKPMWIFARGGGGVAGYAFGEFGLRILAVGNGGKDSIFLIPTLGYAGLGGRETCETYGDGSEFCYDDSSLHSGPMVGFGVQWRF